MTKPRTPVEKLLTYVFDDESPLPIAERLDLTDGIYLAPLPPFLLKNDENHHVLAVDPRFSQFYRDHLHGVTLNVTYSGVSELNYEGVKSQEAVAKKKVTQYLLAATIHSPRFCIPVASFVTIPSQKRVCHSGRMMDFGPLQAASTTPLGVADFENINRIYDALGPVLTDEMVGKLPTALRYYQQAFRTDIHWSVRFLGLMMSTEALFSQGTSDVAHGVSLRTACFLKSGREDREPIYKQMKSCYRIRSAIAHGGTPSADTAALNSAFVELVTIVRDTLEIILVSASTRALFTAANKEEFKTSMEDLVRGAEDPEPNGR